jgi:hypothetical protein
LRLCRIINTALRCCAALAPTNCTSAAIASTVKKSMVFRIPRHCIRFTMGRIALHGAIIELIEGAQRFRRD